MLENFKSQYLNIKNTIREEKLNKWNPCYWKELDTGFFISKKITDNYNKMNLNFSLKWKHDLTDFL